MGPLISRFRRKQTTVELLEEIDKEINRLQRNRKVNQDRQQQFVSSLLIYSITAYVIAAIIFFCICFPETWQLRLLYSTPLLIFPVLVWVAKRSLHWCFVQRISSNDTALEELRDRKNQILEDVMETETYKKAREILEKFDAARFNQLEGIQEAVADNTSGPVKIRPPYRSPGTMIHQRARRRMYEPPPGTFDLVPSVRAASQEQNGTPHLPSPLVQEQLADYPAQAVIGAEFERYDSATAQPPRPPMARSLLPRDRGAMDKLMDYLVGDGPDNRYALICQQCFSHNGMALREEFEYLSFRCCYCYWINPARKQRPTAPRLQFFAPPGMRPAHDSDPSASDEESDDKVEDDKIVSPENPPQPGLSECVSLRQPLESAPQPGCEVLSAYPPAGHTENSSDSELGDSGWKRPAADCDALTLGEEDSLEEAHTSQHVGMSAEMIPSTAATLNTQPGDGLHQSASEKLHSSEILQLTAPADQHSGKKEPETLQAVMPLEQQVTLELKQSSWHANIESVKQGAAQTHSLSVEDLRDSLDSPNSGQLLTIVDVSHRTVCDSSSVADIARDGCSTVCSGADIARDSCSGADICQG